MRITALVLCALAFAAQAETLADYGRQCAQAIAEVPAFDCQAGEEIPITVDGKRPAQYTANMRCDKPSLLPAGEAGAQGQCLPGSRALVLRDDATAQISAICRKKVVRDPDSPLYDEINLIAHSPKNGKTCWFTAKAAEPLRAERGLDGRAVPSPTQPRAWRPAQAYWLSPRAVAQSKPACINCHDSGPFMYSPYIAQTKQLPSDPFGRYQPKAIGKDFQAAWAQLHVFGITTRGNTCTACHRIGNLNSCHVAMCQSTGRAPQEGADAWAQQFPQSHWMSPGNLHSRLQWDVAFADSLRKLSACCRDPQGPGCEVQAFGDRPVPTIRAKAAAGLALAAQPAWCQ
jgi:hypothetical protein